MIKRYFWLVLLIPLCSCVGTGDGGSIPLIPFPSLPANPPAPPMAPPIFQIQSDDKKYEQHGAVDQASCYQMAARFKKEGRKVTLAKIVKNHLNKGGGVLEFLCFFEGEDADLHTSVFEDYRYNSPSEYQYP